MLLNVIFSPLYDLIEELKTKYTVIYIGAIGVIIVNCAYIFFHAYICLINASLNSVLVLQLISCVYEYYFISIVMSSTKLKPLYTVLPNKIQLFEYYLQSEL